MHETVRDVRRGEGGATPSESALLELHGAGLDVDFV